MQLLDVKIFCFHKVSKKKKKLLISCEYILSLSPIVPLRSRRDHRDSFASFREQDVVFPTSARRWVNDSSRARSLTCIHVYRGQPTTQGADPPCFTPTPSPNYVIVGFLADSSCDDLPADLLTPANLPLFVHH